MPKSIESCVKSILRKNPKTKKSTAWAVCTKLWKQGKLTEQEGGNMLFFKLSDFVGNKSDDVKIAKVCDETGSCKIIEFKEKLDPKVKIYNDSNVVFSANSVNVTDDKNHFRIGNIGQAKNALVRMNQFEEAPSWYKGSLENFKTKVRAAVKRNHPVVNIKASEEEETCDSCNDLFRTVFEEPIDKIEFKDGKRKKDDDSDDEEDVKMGEIELIRSGTFDHSWYGLMKFDKKVFNSFMNNFKNNVIGRELSFDYSHDGRSIAAGWLKKLEIKRRKVKNKMSDILVGHVELTNRALEYLINKELKYFSIEFLMDYKDNESGEVFGPTLLGGGFTNRPFIKFLNPAKFELSEDNDIEGQDVVPYYIPFEEYEEECEKGSNSNNSNSKEADEVKLKEILAKLKEAQEKIKELNDQLSSEATDNAGLKTSVAALTEKVNDLASKLEEAQEAEGGEAGEAGTGNAEGSKAGESGAGEGEANAGESSGEANEGANEASDEEGKKFADLTDQVKKLSDSIDNLSNDNKALKKEKRLAEIETFKQKAKAEGIPPAMLDSVVGKLEAEKISLEDAQEFIGTVPENARVELGESTESHQSDPKAKGAKFKTNKDVQTYADDNKMGFGEAAIALAGEGFELEDQD